MRKSTRLPLALLAIWPFAAVHGPALGEEASLVADLAIGSEGRGSGKEPMILVEDRAAGRQLVYYAADDQRHGNELWVTEFSAAGRSTHLVADLCPGACSSKPRSLTVVDDRLFFLADEGLYQNAIFTTRGTDATTVRVRLLARGEHLFGGRYAAFAGHFFFLDLGPAGDCPALWASDGTPGGTRPIFEHHGCALGQPIRELRPTASGLFFQSAEGIHQARPDPADPDGFAVRLVGAQGAYFSLAVELGGALVYTADNKLYRTDGGSVRLLRTFALPIYYLQRFGERVIFYAAPGNQPGNLMSWHQSDGTVAGTVAIEAVRRDPGALLPRSAGDPVLLFFDYPHHHLVAATLTKRVVLLETDALPETLPNTAVGQGVAFALGGRLYHVDATLALRVVGDYAGVAKTSLTLPAARLGAGGDTLYRLDDGNGYEPFFAEKGYQAPGRLADIARDGVESASPRPMATATGYLALLRSDLLPIVPDGHGLVALDADAGSAILVDPGPYRWLEATGGRLFLHTPELNVQALAASTGGPAELLGVDWVSVDYPRSLQQMGAWNGSLYFTTAHPGQDLWVSDGTLAGTTLLHDSWPGWTVQCPIICDANQVVDFPTGILVDGERLFWERSAGFEGGYVGALYTARHGEANGELLADGLLDPRPRYLWQGLAYGTTGQAAPELWVSDGTPAGTGVVAQLHPGTEKPTLFAGHGDAVYFAVHRRDGQELWRSDGTPEGTGLFFDFGPGAKVGEMLEAGSRLFFAVATPQRGSELWAIAGGLPYLVRDLYPGPRSSNPSQLHALADGRLVFAADDGVAGAEAWITDGKAAGTRLLADLGPGGSGPQYFAERAGRLVFAADDGSEHGRELWTLVPSPPAPRPALPKGTP